jgi:hypothetical protein
LQILCSFAPFLVISTDFFEISTCIHRLRRRIVPSVGSPVTNWKQAFPALQEDERSEGIGLSPAAKAAGKRFEEVGKLILR